MYDEIVPVLTRNLNAMTGVLDKAEAHCRASGTAPEDIMSFAFAPDMWPFHRQVRAAADHCWRVCYRLAGETPPQRPDPEPTFDGLRAWIAASLERIAATDSEVFRNAAAARLSLPAGSVTLELTGEDYIRKFIVPNVYFHFTVAYTILRHKGMPMSALNKFDFVGGF